jgi:peroxiredoxin
MLKLGQAAPLFEVQDLRGKPYALENDLGDRIIVLTFWSLFCEQCKVGMRILDDVQSRYDERGVRILAVSVEGEPLADRIRAYVDESGYDLKFLLDEQANGGYAVADTYNVPGTPALYVIGKSGEIVYVRSGHITSDELSRVIDWALTRG